LHLLFATAKMKQVIRGVRYKCLDCPDWDYCTACVQHSSRTHPGHRFVPFWEAVPPVTQRLERHYGIHCDGPLCNDKGAHAFIVGDRYKCAVCHDTDFCAKCEALPTQSHNRTHPLIKFKSPIRNVSVTTLGEKENGEHMVTMGDQIPPTRSKSTESTPATKLANAATQVHSVPTDTSTESAKDEPKVEPKTPSIPGLQARLSYKTLEDGTVMPPNNRFHEIWTVRNSGPNEWPAGCSLRFVGGDAMFDVEQFSPGSVDDLDNAARSRPENDIVEPGHTVDFKKFLKAPLNLGWRVSYWRMQDAEGNLFGDRFACAIQVDAPQPAFWGPEIQTNHCENIAQESKTQDNEESGSQMIFPKLEKESPVGSTHEATREPLSAPACYQELTDDLEKLELASDDESDDGFFTDEEYDLLDVSDVETCVAPNGRN
jgi:next to BRCA1 gene 1 protein